jgi:hypothetical protein
MLINREFLIHEKHSNNFGYKNSYKGKPLARMISICIIPLYEENISTKK